MPKEMTTLEQEVYNKIMGINPSGAADTEPEATKKSKADIEQEVYNKIMSFGKEEEFRPTVRSETKMRTQLLEDLEKGEKPITTVFAEAISKIPEAAAGRAMAKKAGGLEMSAKNWERTERLINKLTNPLEPAESRKEILKTVEKNPSVLQMGPILGLEVQKRTGGIPTLTAPGKVERVSGGIEGFPKELKTREGVPIELYEKLEKPDFESKISPEAAKALNIDEEYIRYKLGLRDRYLPVITTSERKIPILVRDLETGKTEPSEVYRALRRGEVVPGISPKERSEILVQGTSASEASQAELSRALKPLEMLDIPFRAIGGLAKGAQENLAWLANPAGEPPKGLFKTVWESITGEDIKRIGDVFVGAIEAAKGKEATDTEKTLAGIAGLAAELLLPIFPAKGGLPNIPQMGKQVAKSVAKVAERAPYSDFMASYKAATGIPIEANIGKHLANLPSHPERFEAARKIARGLAEQVGANADEAEKMLLRIVGVHGENLGKSGWWWPGVTKKEIIPVWKTSEKKVEEFLSSPRAELAGKVNEAPLIYKQIAGTVQYGADLPSGALDVARKVTAETNSMIEAAQKAREHINRLLGRKFIKTKTISESERVALIADWDFVRQQYLNDVSNITRQIDNLSDPALKGAEAAEANKKIKELYDLMDAKKAGFEKIKKDMLKTGISEDDLAKGIEGLSDEGKAALGIYRTIRKQNLDAMLNAGVDINELPDAVSRIAKKQPLLKRLFGTAPIEVERAVKVEGIAHKPTAGVLPVEAGVSLAGSGSKTVRYQFIKELQDITLAETVYASHLTAAADTENKMLQYFGREIKSLKELHSLEQSGAAKGMKLYYPRIGKFRGTNPDMPGGSRAFLVDSSIADHLEKITAKDSLDRVLDALTKMESFFKVQATMTRPGFVFRNMFFGNALQMYIAGVSPNSLQEAVRIAYNLSKRVPYGVPQDIPKIAWLEHMFKESALTGKKKIAGKTIEEWEHLLKTNKVTGTGWYGGEMSELARGVSTSATLLQRMNILGSRSFLVEGVRKLNTYAEDVSKIAIFVDRIKKGYTADQAVADVAKYLFHYDELSKPVRAARSVFPFLTWAYKNYGLQLWAGIHRPGKIAKYWRAKEGLENLDPPTPEEQYIESFLGEDEEYQGLFRVPFVRGERGYREYLTTASLTPMQEVVKLKPKYFLRSMVEMMHPIIRLGIKAAVQSEGELKYTPFGKPGDYLEQGYVKAPNFISNAMFRIRAMDKNVYEKLSNVFVPQYDNEAYLRLYIKYLKDHTPKEAEKLAREKAPVKDYLWNRKIEEYIAAFDPGLSRLTTMFRGGTEIEEFDRWRNWLFGIKPFEYTPERAEYDLTTALIGLVRQIEKEEKLKKQSGTGKPEIRSYAK